MEDINETTLNNLVKTTFKFEPDSAEPKSLGLFDLLRRKRQTGMSLMPPVRIKSPTIKTTGLEEIKEEGLI